MYELSDIAKQLNCEQREQALLHRNARRVRALHRTRRTMVRAERRLSEAHNEALRLRWELQAES